MLEQLPLGQVIMQYIPYSKQQITKQDIEAVIRTMQSDFITQGPVVTEFEQSICLYTGAKFCIAVNSGTSALHIACLGLGLGADDLLWTSPISFVASANCALYCGAKVDFVDIDRNTYNMCPNKLETKLKLAKKLPKIVIPIHFAGAPCDMQAFRSLAIKYGFLLIEDACHALGANYNQRPIGSCEYSEATVFSFHPVKTITTAEGGAITTNNENIYKKLQSLRSHGITRDPSQLTDSHGPWYYEQLDLGFNYRITDVQCALGISQLQRLDDIVKARLKIARQYQDILQGLPIKLPYFDSKNMSAHHLYPIHIAHNRKEIFCMLRENNIGVNVHYIPIHYQPYYQKMGFKKGDFPHAEAYYDGAISLPIYPELSNVEIKYISAKLNEAIVIPA